MVVRLWVIVVFGMLPLRCDCLQQRSYDPQDTPLMYALLKQKLECSSNSFEHFYAMVRQIEIIALATGCGIVSATVIDYYLCRSGLVQSNYLDWFLWAFGTVVNNNSNKASLNDSQKKSERGTLGVAVKAQGGIRLRTKEELKGIMHGVTDAANASASITQQTFSSDKTIIKPLFCFTSIISYVLCSYLLRPVKTPYRDVLTHFVAQWSTNKLRTPREFHAFFNGLYNSYALYGELLMSEQVAMTTVRQIITICTSTIIKALGTSDTDANSLNNDYQKEMVFLEKESLMIGWQLLPFLSKLSSYFFT